MEDLSPLSVVDFELDSLIDLIQHQTGWNQRNEILHKPQLVYLHKYLKEYIDNATTETIVAESNYIDRHYLEDYSEYYARCFPRHPRSCSRLHFFSHHFSYEDFSDAAAENNKEFISKISENYIGFAVIRPMPQTFLAQLCLKPPLKLGSNPNYSILFKKHKVSLFGIPLEVETTAFLEQDKVVSACATSGLWALLNASPHISAFSQPSPSAITKAASYNLEGARTFPSEGLDSLQIIRSLKFFGLEPYRHSFKQINKTPSEAGYKELKEIIYGFVCHNIPVLIGGKVYEEVEKEQYKLLGDHLVCVVGYHTTNSISGSKDELQLASSEIDKIYVHDDRYGPYMRILTDPITPFKVKKETTGYKGLKLGVNSSKQEIFMPETLFVGMYHKIRLTYLDVLNPVKSLYSYLYQSAFIISKATIRIEKEKKAPKYYIAELQKRIQNIDNLLSGVWEIVLTTNTEIKSELLSSTNFYTFNGSDSKQSILFKSLPKYIWMCRVWKINKNKRSKYTDILFDATEIPQGKILLGYVSYSREAERVWKHAEHQINNKVWDYFKFDKNDQENKKFISCFSSFFDEPNATVLTSLYGHLNLPKGKYKIKSSSKRRTDIHVVIQGNNSFNWDILNEDKRYVWVINKDGDLVFGQTAEQKLSTNEDFLSLLQGKPARLGGEFYYSDKKSKWLVNCISKVYSEHIEQKGLGKSYLKNVLKNNFINKGKFIKA